MKPCLPFLIIFLATTFSFACTSDTIPTKHEIEQSSVYINCGQDSIFGYVFRPVGVESNIPAAIFLQGGGDVGLDNYLYEAQYFAKLGMVTLVCDKAGSGQSKGKSFWRQQSFNQKVDEYSILFEWLRNQAGVDRDKVGVHGMSEGGRLAVALAIKNSNVAFVNSVSGPLESYKENHLFAVGNYLKEQGVRAVTIDEAVELWRRYLEQIGEGVVEQNLIDEVNKFRASNPDIQYLPSTNTRLPERPLTEDIHYVLGGSLHEVKCPILFQYGEDDILVDAVAASIIIPESPLFQVKMYQNTNHNMTIEGYVHLNYDSDKEQWLMSLGIIQ